MKEHGYQWDPAGLSVYRYLRRYPIQSLDKTGSDAVLPPDPCFIPGNHRLTAFAHVSGPDRGGGRHGVHHGQQYALRGKLHGVPGVEILSGTLLTTLLRAPTSSYAGITPDETSSQHGDHTFAFALYPYQGPGLE